MKKMVALFLALVLVAPLISVPVHAQTVFVDNENWHEVSAQTVTQMYNDNQSFVVVFFRRTCFNSNLRKAMIDDWMKTYGLHIYGVDVDQYSIPLWVWSALDTTSVTLPVICVVDEKKVDGFDAEDSMRSIQKRLQEYLGVYDERETTFYRLNERTYNAYSQHLSTAEEKYCMPADQINWEIRAEANRIVDGLSSDRDKAKAIYDWVTSNIYYDYGMLDGTHPIRTSAEETYIYRGSICSGYANLTAALFHAAGIPCRVITGFATGIDAETSAVWELYKDYLENGTLQEFDAGMGRYTNHAWNEAFVDGEWIIIDTTWGSNNEWHPYEGSLGGISAPPTDAYFDPDLEWISESHLFWEDHSSDFFVTSNDGEVFVIGTLAMEDIDSAEHILLVAYDEDGKMLECAAGTLSGDTIRQTLTKAGNAKTIKAILLDKQYSSVCMPYMGMCA